MLIRVMSWQTTIPVGLIGKLKPEIIARPTALSPDGPQVLDNGNYVLPGGILRSLWYIPWPQQGVDGDRVLPPKSRARVLLMHTVLPGFQGAEQFICGQIRLAAGGRSSWMPDVSQKGAYRSCTVC